MLRKTHILDLYHFKKDIVLNYNASEYGIGGILSHIIEGKEKLLVYASRIKNKFGRNMQL